MLLSGAASVSLAALGGAASAMAGAWTLPPKRPFKIIENEWIPMADGVRLAARLWIPQGAERHPVPVVFEYLPYRLWDDLRWRDDKTGDNLAPYGVAFVRVDIRGTGNSEGVMVDEYDVPEHVRCTSSMAGAIRTQASPATCSRT
jgi:predicted acyl esterase